MHKGIKTQARTQYRLATTHSLLVIMGMQAQQKKGGAGEANKHIF